MSDPLLLRVLDPEQGPRYVLQVGETVSDVHDAIGSLSDWLADSVGRAAGAIDDLREQAAAAETRWPRGEFALPLLAPVDEQEVWAAGVTYEDSRKARQEEAVDGGDVYARVYVAERPEIFFKAQAWRVIGPGGEVGIRYDASWSVPEPELGVVYNPAMEAVGFTVGNDMSSRDIEGANPLYLPQAKMFTASCALGPGIALRATEDWPDAQIRMRIEREGGEVFRGSIHTSRIRRRIPELGDFLGRSYSLPKGAVLLTGTAIVPPPDFTLVAGDVIVIGIDGIGELMNVAQVV
ncbi:MAG: fumarylacetoacetate hydrolase family protein [Anaerolineaceae bacterium]|nr:fumarylacetoacetate hydrolase family protein [Anaerolineaceae bacterium]